MALGPHDIAILSSRVGVARVGASRVGFCPDDVEGKGDEPGEYIWKEDFPPTTLWQLESSVSFCGQRPVASFTDAPDPTHKNTDVQFTDTSTPVEVITFWYWEFGDGGTSNDQHPVHQYAATGVYTVTLYVAGPRGSASTTGTVTVQGTVLEGTVTFDDGGGVDPCSGHTVELRDALDVVQASTTTNAAGFYQFVDPTVTMLDGEGFKVYVYSVGTCAGCVDTFDDAHLWMVDVTQVVDIVMDGI